jgi:hypothetical protein
MVTPASSMMIVATTTIDGFAAGSTSCTIAATIGPIAPPTNVW